MEEEFSYHYNDSIQAALVRQATNVENSYRTRFRAIESLSLFNYWDSYIPRVLMDLLSEPEIRLQVIELWGEYASDNRCARRALHEAFRQPHTPPMRLYLAMALVKSGVSDNPPIKILVDEGLNDALVTRYCAQLLGKSGNRESFVIQALMEKFRASLDGVGSLEMPAYSLLFINVEQEPEGTKFVADYGNALLRLDKYNEELLPLLPKGISCSTRVAQEIGHTYLLPFRFNWTNTLSSESMQHLIRQKRQ